MKTERQTSSAKKDVQAASSRDARGFTILKVAPVTQSDRKKIENIIKWEDESAKADFVISGMWNKRVAAK